MMTFNGSPTPKGVGGPSPPLVSRGSEKGWEMEIPTMGFPSVEGGGGKDPPLLRGGSRPRTRGIGGGTGCIGKGRNCPSPPNTELEITLSPTSIGEDPHPPGWRGYRLRYGARTASRADPGNCYGNPI